jgi:hypothetical protein
MTSADIEPCGEMAERADHRDMPHRECREGADIEPCGGVWKRRRHPQVAS